MTAPPVPLPTQHSLSHVTSLAFSDFLVDDIASPATEGSASDEVFSSTSATTPEHHQQGTAAGKPLSRSTDSLNHSVPSSSAMPWQSGSGDGRFTVDGGGTTRPTLQLHHSTSGGYDSHVSSAGTSPAVTSHMDQVRASAGPMRSTGIAMPTAPSRHGRHASDLTAHFEDGASGSSFGRSSTTFGRRSRQGSASGLSISPNVSAGFHGPSSHKPYARPQPLTPSHGFTPIMPWATPVPAGPPSAGLSPILSASSKTSIGALDIAALDRQPDSARVAAAASVSPVVPPAALARKSFAALTASAGASPPSRGELDTDSPEALASADPLATQLWKFYAKAKKALPDGQRMENLSWRMGGMKLGQMAAERESSLASASPSTTDPERGRSVRTSVAQSPFNPEDDAMDIDWRAKSRSRSRAPNRDAMDLDSYGTFIGSGNDDLSQFLASLTESAEPAPAPPPVDNEPYAGLRAAFAADVAAHTPAPAVRSADDELAAILGLSAPLTSSSFAVPRSRSTLPPRAQTLEDHALAHAGGAMPRQIGSVPGLRNEAQLPSNQHHEYGFIPRLVRKTSFDGLVSPQLRNTAQLPVVAPAEAELYAAVNATHWPMPTSEPGTPAGLRPQNVPVPPALRHSFSPSSFLPASTSTPSTPLSTNSGHHLSRVSSGDQMQMFQQYYHQQAAVNAMMPAAVPLQYPYAAFLAQHHARAAMRLAAASNAYAAANGLPPPIPGAPTDPANATFGIPVPPVPTSSGGDANALGGFVSPATVMPWQLGVGGGVVDSPSPNDYSSPDHRASVGMSAQSSASRHPPPPPSLQQQAGPSNLSPPVASPSKAVDPNISCTNCKTSNTPLWRRDELGRPLCNGCGLFRKLHGVDRPLSLATGIVKKRNRGSRMSKEAAAAVAPTPTQRKPRTSLSSKRGQSDPDETFTPS